MGIFSRIFKVAQSEAHSVVDQLEDGRIRIRYINPRPDGIQVFIKGRRRS